MGAIVLKDGPSTSVVVMKKKRSYKNDLEISRLF